MTTPASATTPIPAHPIPAHPIPHAHRSEASQK
ncbi:MAG: hypothetical protein JWP76_433 [Dactylosporangium sp.]|nr:hypothetical protein [Dactylosporangium sp.]